MFFPCENWCECMIQPMCSFDTHGASVLACGHLRFYWTAPTDKVMRETLEPLCSMILQFVFHQSSSSLIKSSISVNESDLSDTSPP